ncbi:MAG: folate family ECF transporter S component [Clostridiales bacterium]|jgi:ECF transporter S component (folate family)|nr:folate family ECF transporter S component [Clostridiales bacterium]
MFERIKHSSQIQRITICAMLIALGVVLKGVLSVSFPITSLGVKSMNIGFGMLPILLICVLYGPLYGCAGALSWDVISAFVFPMGGFQPWFSISAALFGLITGMFFIKTPSEKYTTLRIFTACAVGQIAYSVIFNTFLLIWLFNLPAKPLFIARSLENLIMIPLNTLILSLIINKLKVID